MRYEVAPFLGKNLLCLESPFNLELGSRVIFYRREIEEGVIFEEGCSNPSGLILGKLQFNLDRSRLKLSQELSNTYGYSIPEYISLHFPKILSEYEELFLFPTTPLSSVTKMPLEDFLQKKGEKHLLKLVRDGLAEVRSSMRQPNILFKREESVSIGTEISEILRRELDNESMEIVEFVMKEGSVTISELLKNFRRKHVKRLLDEGILSNKFDAFKVNLREDQKKAVRSLKVGVNLLFGETGSGKTEVFLECIKDKKALVLVPEVSLIPQLYRRISKRFPKSRIGVYHSYLSKSRRIREWIDSFSGKVDILIGTRSALFVPSKWEVLVADEEHDESYYQREGIVYDGIEVLKMIARIYSIPLILSSATPRLEDYYMAKEGEYNLMKIGRSHKRPSVNVVDLRKEGRFGLLSKQVLNEIQRHLDSGHGIMIFVRRKGYGRVKCTRCGYVVKCDNCDVPMTFHLHSKTFKCHICGKEIAAFDKCPKCGAPLKVFGVGSEKVESFLRKVFPEARIERADREMIVTPDRLIELLDLLEKKKIDILVGTKMIIKGIDIPRVKLMVVVDSDGLMAMPDFTARVRTFQMIHQAVGRSGRKGGGSAFVQHWGMDERLIEFVKNGDVIGFYEDELRRRKDLNYPPFSNIIHVLYSSSNASLAESMIESVSSRIKVGEILGPSAYPIPRIKGKYTYHFLVKTQNPKETLHEILKEISVKDRRNWKVLVNPLTLL